MHTLTERLAISLAANITEKLRLSNLDNQACVNLDEAIKAYPHLKREYAIFQYMIKRDELRKGVMPG